MITESFDPHGSTGDPGQDSPSHHKHAKAAGLTRADRKAHRDAVREEKAQRRGPVLQFLIDAAGILLFALVLSFLIKTFLIRSFYIPSESMQDTLLVNDRIIVNQLVPDLAPIHRGDVVVFTDPGGWLPTVTQADKPPFQAFIDGVLTFVGLAAADSEQHIIKRVIGTEGDHIVCCDADGRITVNGAVITEPYIKIPVGETRASGSDIDVVVPEDSLWVMGDNRYNSADSRFHSGTPLGGFVPESDVVGHAFVIVWPFNRFGLIDSHGSVFESVPAPTPAP